MLFSTLSFSQQGEGVSALKKLSIEELMNIEVTSVSRGPQKLTDVASAIQVITREDIMRSAATSVPEALRLATNLQVAQLNSSAWIIGSRGFNTVFANKLLVLIDGRTVYTPLFGGVIWELQSVLLEDVDRIEVISGPGGTMWGANAVNGVINIITKRSNDVQGAYGSMSIGSLLNYSFAARYGKQVNQKFSWKVYAQHSDRDATFLPTGGENADDWKFTQAGFRADWSPSFKDNLTFQGDMYFGLRRTKPTTSPFDGQNIMTRWTHSFSESSEFVLQGYFDRYWRDDPTALADQMATYDVDFQHRFMLGKNHHILWGLGYRMVNDEICNRSPIAGLLPEDRLMPLYSGFIQDEVVISDALRVTVGTKILDQFFSGFEIQPSARVAWSVDNDNMIWGAVSRAIRAPSRLDVDYRLPLDPPQPGAASVMGTTNFQSEKLLSYELGYRVQPNRKSSLSLATFYHHYDDVYSVEAPVGTANYEIQNGSIAESWGVEFSGFYQLIKAWRIRGGFTYFAKDLRPKPGRIHDPSYLGNDAKHQALLQSIVNLPLNFQLDVVTRYTDYLPQTFATARVPEYFTFDARLAWQLKVFEFSVVGQNLWADKHTEFGSSQIPRSIYGRVTCRF